MSLCNFAVTHCMWTSIVKIVNNSDVSKKYELLHNFLTWNRLVAEAFSVIMNHALSHLKAFLADANFY
jgi:hypothetical protein